MRSVIFNADDFGASENANRAIIRAHREGVLTSASLMVNERTCQEAVLSARECPELGVGLHLALSAGRPSLPASEIGALVGPRGDFPASPAAAGLRAFFRPSARRQVREEVRAQFERFDRTGLPWSHVDGHQHLHVHPVIWDAMIEQAKRFGAGWVRIPNEEFVPFSPERRTSRRFEWLFFLALRERCIRSLREAGIGHADRVYGHLETGRMTEAYLLHLLPRLSGETIEIYSHPGSPAPGARHPDAADEELGALLSRPIRDMIDRLQLRRVSFHSLANEVAGMGSAESVRVE